MIKISCTITQRIIKKNLEFEFCQEFLLLKQCIEQFNWYGNAWVIWLKTK